MSFGIFAGTSLFRSHHNRSSNSHQGRRALAWSSLAKAPRCRRCSFSPGPCRLTDHGSLRFHFPCRSPPRLVWGGSGKIMRKPGQLLPRKKEEAGRVIPAGQSIMKKSLVSISSLHVLLYGENMRRVLENCNGFMNRV